MRRRDFAMIRTVVFLSAFCGLARSSIEHGQGFVPVFSAHGGPAPPPVVAATSSQYFQRNFNRLVLPPPVIQPVVPVQPAIPQQPVFLQPAPNAVPLAPVAPVATAAPAPPTPSEPVQPNVAIAVATTNFAAPVATILLPPYPFGPPPSFGIAPLSPPINVPDDRKESTTQRTTQAETKTTTTTKQPEATTPLPAGSDNNFNVQALPSNQNVNFNQVYGPPPLPQIPLQKKPQKFKTSVEIVPVPLAYIAPPPLKYQAVKTVKHVHTFLPLKAKVFIRPVHHHHVHSPLRVHKVIRPVRLVHKVPVDRIGRPSNVRRPVSREVEPTTFRPVITSGTKPPRL